MTAAVEIANFSCRYPDGTVALECVNLIIDQGEHIALVGPNGAGKSSMLLAIGGFLQGTGTIRVGGIDVCPANSRKLRSVLGCCMEDPDDQLFMPTLYEDVAFGPLNMGLANEEVRARTMEALRRVGLLSMADKAPHHLSAGQKRAAAVATVLSMSPKIVTMDEPDGSLDPRNRRILEELLSGLTQTLIIATCNMRFALAVAQRAVVINQGKVVADGSVDILHNPDLMLQNGLETP